MNKIALRRMILAGAFQPYAMVSFLEGLLRAPKGSISGDGNYSGTLRQLRNDPRLIARFGGQDELEKFLDGRYAFDDAVMRGAKNLARKYPHLIGDSGRQSAEELAQNLMAGLTLVGNEMSTEGNIFRRTGLTLARGGAITGVGVERALTKFTQDQGRALRTTRAPMLSLNAPLGDDSSMTFLDLVEEGQFSTNEIGDLMMQATDGLGLAYFDSCMKRKNLTRNQYEVWQTILAHPEVVELTEGGWRTRGEQICRHRARIFPDFEPGTNCRNTIRKPTNAVLKRLDECIEDRSFTQRVRQNKELLDTVSGRRASIRRVASTHLSRTANNHPLKVGDILYSSWGYDQTNIDFYEVLKVTKSMAIIHRIDSRIVRRDIPYDYVVPVPGKLSSRGKPLRKRVRSDGMVGISSYAIARPWDGKPKGQTTFGYGH